MMGGQEQAEVGTRKIIMVPILPAVPRLTALLGGH